MFGRIITVCRCALPAMLALAAGCGRPDSPPSDSALLAIRSTTTQGPLRFESDPRPALSRARSEGRPTLLFFASDDCPCCREMRSGTFKHPQVLALASEFVCAEVRWGQGGEHDALCREFGVAALPCVVLLSPSGTELQRSTGLQRGRRLAASMHTALRMATRQAARAGAPRR